MQQIKHNWLSCCKVNLQALASFQKEAWKNRPLTVQSYQDQAVQLNYYKSQLKCSISKLDLISFILYTLYPQSGYSCLTRHILSDFIALLFVHNLAVQYLGLVVRYCTVSFQNKSALWCFAYFRCSNFGRYSKLFLCIVNAKKMTLCKKQASKPHK